MVFGLSIIAKRTAQSVVYGLKWCYIAPADIHLYISLRRGPRKIARQDTTRINDGIGAKEVRVIAEDGGNIGVMSTADAIAKAQEANLDLIEISPKAKPPIAKIMDYGKYQYLNCSAKFFVDSNLLEKKVTESLQ